MKSTIMPKILETLAYWSLVVVVVAMPVHAFISTWGGTAIGPMWLWKSWKELLLGVIALAVIGWIVSRPDVTRYLAGQRLSLLLIAYAVVVLGSAVLGWGTNGAEATLAAVAMDLRYLVAFAIAYLVIRFGTRVQKSVFTHRPLLLVYGAVGLAVIGILQVTVLPLDFLSDFGYDKTSTIAPYTLIDDNRELPRAFATLSGPNDFAAYLLLPLAICLIIVIRTRSFAAAAAAAVVTVGIYLSSSRSAWLGAVVMILVILMLSRQRIWFSSRRIVMITIGLAVATSALLLLALSVPTVRLQVFHSSPGDSSLVEGSTSDHWAASAEGVRRVIDNPIGCGAGCSGPASFYGDRPLISENYYLQIAEQYGLLGLGLWVAICAAVIRRLWTSRHELLSVALIASFAGLSVIGLWLHVWADDPVSLTWWIVAGAVIGYNEHKWNESKNKSR